MFLKHFSKTKTKLGINMKKLKCGVLGATGMVGRKLLEILSEHPWIEVVAVAASERSEGKKLKFSIPTEDQPKIERKILELTIKNIFEVVDISEKVDFVFCAVNLEKDEIIKLEEAYARREVVVVSNNSATRFFDDIPMIVPEINGISHLKILDIQKQRLGTKKGCIVVKPNCAAQAYMAILDALKDVMYIKNINVSLMQAISGSGKFLSEVPEIQGNVLPLPDEALKSIKEPKKIFGKIIDGKIVDNENMNINAISYRVPVQDGHLANIFIQTSTNADIINNAMLAFQFYNPLEDYKLPSSPRQVINYLGNDVFPNPKRDANNQNGMEFTCGAMNYDEKTGILQITGLIHNLIRGAAGGAVLTAELMIKLGYITSKN